MMKWIGGSINAGQNAFFLVATGACLAVALVEQAACHVIISSHTPRHESNFIKHGPCGRIPSERGNVIHVFEPGETIHLQWNEFVSHPGYFRISFDDDGHDDFADPADYHDFYSNASVLVDNIFPHQRSPDSGTYEFDLTLPNVECENCTIQLIQMMTDKPPYVAGTDDIYYNCLDITLESIDGIQCDFNGDDVCDGIDIDLLMNEATSGGVETDVTDDGIVDHTDRDMWLALAGQENGFAEPLLVGDSNTDGTVDSKDLNNVALNWQAKDVLNWTDGNFSADGNPGVNPNDLNALALTWRRSSAIATSIPEPSVSFLWFVAAVCWLDFRSRS